MTRQIVSSVFLTLRNWRFTVAEPSGMSMWFDPLTESPLLRSTPPPETGRSLLTPLLDPWELSGGGGVGPPEGSDSEEDRGGVQENGQLEQLSFVMEVK